MMRKAAYAALVCALLLPCAAWAQSGQMPGARGTTGETASLTRRNQVVQGGARVRSQCALGTGPVPIASCIVSSGTLTINPGLGPIQFVENNGAFTLSCPVAPVEGAVLLYVLNGASAGAVTVSNCGTAASTTITINTPVFAMYGYSNVGGI